MAPGKPDIRQQVDDTEANGTAQFAADCEGLANSTFSDFMILFGVRDFRDLSGRRPSIADVQQLVAVSKAPTVATCGRVSGQASAESEIFESQEMASNVTL
jgi:hypothetical protein